jgi:hypothetical protein
LQAICSTAANEVSAGDDLKRDCANAQCACTEIDSLTNLSGNQIRSVVSREALMFLDKQLWRELAGASVVGGEE